MELFSLQNGLTFQIVVKVICMNRTQISNKKIMLIITYYKDSLNPYSLESKNEQPGPNVQSLRMFIMKKLKNKENMKMLSINT